MWDPYAEFDKTVLNNGTEIWASHWPGRHWQIVGMQVHAGCFHDPPGEEGLCHLVEHLVGNGFPLPYQELMKSIEELGGWTNLASFNPFDTRSDFFVPAEISILQHYLSLYGQMFSRFEFSDESIEKERERIKTETSRKARTPGQELNDQRWAQQLFQNTWISRRVNPLTKRLEKTDRLTRDNAMSYLKKYYHSHNISLVTVGGIPPNEMIRMIAASPFGTCPSSGGRTPLPNSQESLVPPSEKCHEIPAAEWYGFVKQRGLIKSESVIPAEATSNHTMDIICGMIDQALIPLTTNTGIYDIHVNWNDHGEVISLKISSEGLDRENLLLLSEEIDRTLNSLTEQAESFQSVQKILINKKKNIDLDGSRLTHHAMSDLSMHHRIIPLSEEISTLEKLTLDALAETISWIQKQRWTYRVIP